mmetsp:Transcript_78670/g.220488  ORF Transcript_78670/g.220488 Transcript_78670/m.220488 type:complete len:243 (-) Transcript_78670:96-824(-)
MVKRNEMFTARGNSSTLRMLARMFGTHGRFEKQNTRSPTADGNFSTFKTTCSDGSLSDQATKVPHTTRETKAPNMHNTESPDSMAIFDMGSHKAMVARQPAATITADFGAPHMRLTLLPMRMRKVTTATNTSNTRTTPRTWRPTEPKTTPASSFMSKSARGMSGRNFSTLSRAWPRKSEVAQFIIATTTTALAVAAPPRLKAKGTVRRPPPMKVFIKLNTVWNNVVRLASKSLVSAFLHTGS